MTIDEIGFAVLIAGLVAKFVLDLLSHYKVQGRIDNMARVSWGELSRQIEDLHKWHDVVDDEGVKIWYVRKNLEKAILDLSNNLSEQTKVLQQQSEILRGMLSTLQNMQESMKSRL